ncbi:MAG: MdtA/MuxA family multidrug efflux RND transporter periplasmic adaptor subunit [Planctomycetaceae bacterium]
MAQGPSEAILAPREVGESRSTRLLPPEADAEPAQAPAQAIEQHNGGRRAPVGDKPPRSRLWPWLVAVAVGAAAWHFRDDWRPRLSPTGDSTSATPVRSGVRSIPVRTAIAKRQDLPIYLNGLGTVTAFKTVTLRSRVDGELITVAFSEGQMVREGDLLAEIDPRPYQAQLEQAEGTLARDKASLELAKLTLARGQELFKTRAIAQQQLDEEAAQVRQIEGTVQTDQGLVDNANLQLTYCRITAPISGRIGLRLVDQGNIVHANDVTGMAVITQIQPIAIVFPISQDDIPRVQKSMQRGKPLAVRAYDRGFKTELAAGELYAIDNQVDATTGTVKLKATFQNDDGMLFPNQFVNARLLIETRHDATVVSAAAVQRGPESTFVYVVQPDETVELRFVKLGAAEGGEISLASGVEPGEVVVTDGIEKLQPGSRVTTHGGESPQEQPSMPRIDANENSDGSVISR